jgi:hypothetical protein
MMPPEIPYLNILTPITTVLAVVIASRLSYGRAYKERVWDLRRQAYGLILSELAAIEQICDIADEEISETSVMSYFDGHHRRNEEQIREHMSAIRRRFADDYLILSDRFIALYEGLTKEMMSDPYNSLPPDQHDTFCEAIRKYRPLLTSLARSETTIRNKWRSLFSR